jgi:hypothetical protein
MSAEKKIHHLVLALILLVAAILRFYHFFELPFMWDELSAWSRLHFETFSELISKGVMPDGHPAGVQVFLYYWTHWFGDQEWVIKLPFNLMGLASVLLMYKISDIWFSKESGLIAAAFMASLQFFVLYSPIARPYSSGLFLTLMMVYYWSNYMFRTPKRIYLLLFVLFAALSAYNHHFSLLFAAIVGVSGLLVIPKNLLKEYVISGFAIFILYIPHLKIFFHQLGIGGIGGDGLWLARPDWSFVLDFFYWAFHFSYFNLAIIVLLSVVSIHFCIKKCVYQKAIKIILLLLWVILPLLIGLLYSIYVNPVIQYSMLLFSFPYFILMISICAGQLPKAILYAFIVILMSLNTYQLVYERQHFNIIQNQPFDLTARLSLEQTEKSFIVFNTIPEYQHYYFNKYQMKDQNSYSIYHQNINDQKFDSLLSTRNENILISCGLPPHFENIIRRHFPYVLKRKNTYTMDCYVFSKKNDNKPALFSEEVQFTDFSLAKSNWIADQNRVIEDSLLQHYFSYLEGQEWGVSFHDQLKHYTKNAIIDYEATICADSINIHPLWVMEARNHKDEVFWKGQNLQLLETEKKGHYQSYFSIDTRLIQSESVEDSLTIKSYIWNKQKDKFKVDYISVSQRPENPIKYALFQKIN